MQRMDLHIPNWIHRFHTPDWHLRGSRLDRLLHNERFWAVVALAGLLAVLILAAILSEGSSGGSPMNPIYPTLPYTP